MELIVMEWLNQMNAALAYLEAHLEDDLDYNRMAQLAGCSPYHFQRIFFLLGRYATIEYLRLSPDEQSGLRFAARAESVY